MSAMRDEKRSWRWIGRLVQLASEKERELIYNQSIIERIQKRKTDRKKERRREINMNESRNCVWIWVYLNLHFLAYSNL